MLVKLNPKVKSKRSWARHPPMEDIHSHLPFLHPPFTPPLLLRDDQFPFHSFVRSGSQTHPDNLPAVTDHVRARSHPAGIKKTHSLAARQPVSAL